MEVLTRRSSGYHLVGFQQVTCGGKEAVLKPVENPMEECDFGNVRRKDKYYHYLREQLRMQEKYYKKISS